mmetsp:Transcript_37247/g.107307  ORF Transcript_37247/g.107307 Transcript_37247/m.107307 type:complete len:203 (+) Transcript_37247:838-1446(+)
MLHRAHGFHICHCPVAVRTHILELGVLCLVPRLLSGQGLAELLQLGLEVVGPGLEVFAPLLFLLSGLGLRHEVIRLLPSLRCPAALGHGLASSACYSPRRSLDGCGCRSAEWRGGHVLHEPRQRLARLLARGPRPRVVVQPLEPLPAGVLELLVREPDVALAHRGLVQLQLLLKFLPIVQSDRLIPHGALVPDGFHLLALPV